MNLRTLHLSPESGEGGSFTSGITERGGSGGSSGSDSTPQYVPKGDFDRVSREFGDYRTQNERRWQEFETRLPKPEVKTETATGTKNPHDNIEDYKFTDAQGRPNPKEMARFNRDVFRFEQSEYERERQQKEAPVRQQQEQAQSRRQLEQKFNTSMRDYEKENPGFMERYRSTPIETYDEVQDMIRDSDMGPAVYDHLIEHPETLQEWHNVMMSAVQAGNPNWLRVGERFLGRLENTIESQKKLIHQRENAYRAEPTAGAFPRSSVPKKEKLSPKQLKDLWR